MGHVLSHAENQHLVVIRRVKNVENQSVSSDGLLFRHILYDGILMRGMAPMEFLKTLKESQIASNIGPGLLCATERASKSIKNQHTFDLDTPNMPLLSFSSIRIEL